MSEQQFQILMAVFSFIGAFVIILLGVIAYFIRASLSNFEARLDSHSTTHKLQKDWNEEKAGLIREHSTILSIHDREIFGSSSKRR
jgi:hypothetical protein